MCTPASSCVANRIQKEKRRISARIFLILHNELPILFHRQQDNIVCGARFPLFLMVCKRGLPAAHGAKARWTRGMAKEGSVPKCKDPKDRSLTRLVVLRKSCEAKCFPKCPYVDCSAKHPKGGLQTAFHDAFDVVSRCAMIHYNWLTQLLL